MDIDTGNLTSLEMEIADIHNLGELDKTEFYKTSKWHIELTKGDIFFEAKGFHQYVRQHPSHVGTQNLPMEIRKGVCFDKAAIE